MGEWLRGNSERYLLEAAQEKMAERYLDRAGPVGGFGLEAIFWRRLFVPVYRRIPWPIRQKVIQAMPGSHKQTWHGRSPPSGHTGRAPGQR